MVKRKAKTPVKRKRNVRGTGLASDLFEKAKGFVKKHKLISRGLAKLPYSFTGSVIPYLAKLHGYGRQGGGHGLLKL